MIQKRGLSTVVTTLIIILLVLVAIGIVWVVVGGIISEETDGIPAKIPSVDLTIKKVYVESGTNISFIIKRNPGKGDLDSLKFIISSETETIYEEIIETSLEELGERTFITNFVVTDENRDSLKTFTIIPILGGEEQEKFFSSIGVEYNFATKKTKLVSTGGGGGGGGGGDPGSTCGNGNCQSGEDASSCPQDCPDDNPGAVNGLEAVTITNDSIMWTWTNPDDADFAGTMISFENVNSINYTETEQSTSSHTENNLLPNTIYNLTVNTIDDKNNTGTPVSNITMTEETVIGQECEDGDIEGSEECDGTELGGENCQSLGYDSGDLFCYPSGHANECTFNETSCSYILSCNLIEAYWNASSVVEETLVELIVEGTNCDSEEINFTIMKQEILFGVDWLKKDIVAFEISTTATTTWQAGLNYTGGYMDGDYYFIATLNSDSSQSSTSNLPLLEVTPNIICVDNDLDTFNVTGEGCGPQDCDDTNPEIWPNNLNNYCDCDAAGDGSSIGITEICDGIDNDCDGLIDEEGGILCNNGLYCDGVETCNGVMGCINGPGIDCDDGVSCTDDSCNEDDEDCDNIANNVLCDDGLWCNGAETCDALLDCQFGIPEVIDDGVSCTEDSCDETDDVIVNTPNNALCDNELYCDGEETCDALLDCQDGAIPICDDGVSCSVDFCDEEIGSCDANFVACECPGGSDSECDDGLWCNGAETCNALTKMCQSGSAPNCDDSVACTDDSCNDNTDSCDYITNDVSCGDNLFCNGIETCDINLGCQAGTSVDCNDVVACTQDSCNEGTDSCDYIANDGLCDNGLYCDGTETCDIINGCQLGVDIVCDDGVTCTDDSCNDGTDSCDNLPNNALCDNGEYCDGIETCDTLLGCQDGAIPICDDGISCSSDFCNEAEDSCDANFVACECPGGSDSECDDGLWCNGAETCNALTKMCQSGSAPNCDDSVACTDDSCNDNTDSCDYITNDGLCNNGEYCDGIETCDTLLGCQAGIEITCDDSVSCTEDSCNEFLDDCDYAPNDGLCDDTLFCNGIETCDSVLDCQAGTLPNCDDGVSCTDDSCNEGTDSCDNIANNNNCNAFDLLAIATCINIPDSNPFTWDYFVGFDSTCNDVTDCSQGTVSLTNTCDVLTCGAECDATNPCDDKCEGEVYYSNGACLGDCSCSYDTEDCGAQEGWYDNGNTQWVEDTICTEKEQKEQDYRDYTCGLGCEYSITNTQLVDTGSTRNKADETSCEDGLFCNGEETCQAGICQAGTPEVIDDGVSCTDDSCDETNDIIVNTPNDGLCDDGAWCNGIETCDADLDCQAGTPEVIDDGVSCTDDSCDETNDIIVNTPNDGLCDDTLCPADGCGVGVCGGNIFGDYPISIPNTCSALESCTSNTCIASCEDDLDEDNYSITCGDCNDTEFNVNPGIIETVALCQNGYDDDCVGGDLACENCPLDDSNQIPNRCICEGLPRDNGYCCIDGTYSITVCGGAPGPEPLLWLKFEGNLNSEIGDLNGTWYMAESYVSGYDGQGVSFTGIDGEHIELDQGDDTFLSGMNELTISVWAKKTDSATGGRLIHKNGQFDIGIDGTSLTASLYNNSDYHLTLSGSSSIIDDTNWHQYVLTYNNSQVQLYVDDPANIVDTDILEGFVADNSAKLEIGDYPWTGSGTRAPFNGTIDELRIYGTTVIPPITCTDNDGDNWNTTATCNDGVLVDCNDDNININPGADEVCDDSVDNDCDSDIDCDDIDCSSHPDCIVPPCTLSDADWSTTGPVTEGTTVNLNVQGSDCGGENINFTIMKQEILIFDWLKKDLIVFETSTTATTTWQAGLNSTGDYMPGDYYYIATISNNGSVNINSRDDGESDLVVTLAPDCLLSNSTPISSVCYCDSGGPYDSGYCCDDGADGTYSLTPCGGGGGTYQSSVTREGVTWNFDKDYRVGQFANGDYWVLGPVEITSITPNIFHIVNETFPGEGVYLNGWQVNPTSANRGFPQGFDSRYPDSFDVGLIPSLPYIAQPEQSIVKAVSTPINDETCGSGVMDSYNCLEDANVLTVLGSVPSDGDGSTFFRPPYVHGDKPLYSINDIDLGLLPRYSQISYTRHPGERFLRTAEGVADYYNNLKVDHLGGAGSRGFRPLDNMPNYGLDIAIDNAEAVLVLMQDYPDAELLNASIMFMQYGIDIYHAALDGQYWPPGDNQEAGRKISVLFTGVMLGNTTMTDFVVSKANNWDIAWKEDLNINPSSQFPSMAIFGFNQTYVTTSYSEENYWKYVAQTSGSRVYLDPYGYIDGGRSDNTYQTLFNKAYVAEALVLHLMPELKTYWNNPLFFDYADRWMRLPGYWTLPDPCAPSPGFCRYSGEIDYGVPCNSSNFVEVCTALPHGDCYDPDFYNPDHYGTLYGPDGSGGCILDTNPNDGTGRLVEWHGVDERDSNNNNNKVYAFTRAMWDSYRGEQCYDGTCDAGENSVNCPFDCIGGFPLTGGVVGVGERKSFLVDLFNSLKELFR